MPSGRFRRTVARALRGALPAFVLVAFAVAAWPVSLDAQDAQAEDRGVIRGTVQSRFQDGARRLGAATVQATVDDRIRVVSTDSAGRYRIDRLPAGSVVLRAFHPGHGPVELVVTVPAGGVVDVDLELVAAPIPIAPVEVRGTRGAVDIPETGDRRTRLAGGTAPELEMQALDLGPGVGRDGLVEAVRALPGNDPSDAQDVLFMRGSTTDLKLVLLDGVPVYTPFHVGGLMRSFEPAVLGSADLHVGGAPARYDGGLTHILELRTRPARRDRVRASGSVDLLTASAALESPLGPQAGLIASARSLHDLGRAPLGGSGPYGYRDLLVAFDAEPGRGHELGFTGFLNAEEVLLDYALTPEHARWSNVAGTARYGRDFGGARLDASVGASGYDATLPLQGPAEPGGGSPRSVLARGTTARLRMVTEVTWGSPEEPVRAGVSHERMEAAFQAESPIDASTSESRGRAESTGAFLEATRALAPGITFRGGLRGDYFPGSGFRGAPRASLMWELGPQALLTVAAGRYHQPTRTVDPAVEHSLSEVASVGIQAEEVLPVATADHVVLSLEQRLGRAVNLGLEGFFKRFEGLSRGSSETVRSSGVDLRVVSAGDHASGWLGYGLSWFWSGTDLSGRTTDFSGRHLLTAGLSGRLAGPLSGEARIAYGAGLPYTSIPLPGPQQDSAGEPVVSAGGESFRSTSWVEGLDDEFLRIDLEVYASFEPEWGGRPWTVRPYLRVLNALDRRDAMFYTFQPWRDDSVTPLAERPLLPLLGISFSF